MNEFFKRQAKLGVIMFDFFNHIFQVQGELWYFSEECLAQCHTNVVQVLPTEGT